MADQVEVQKTTHVEQPKPTSVPDNDSPPAPETDEPLKPIELPTETTEVSIPSAVDDDKIPQSVSFQEETTKVSDLPDFEKKSLDELKQLVQLALDNHEFTALPPAPVADQQSQLPPPPSEEEEKVDAAVSAVPPPESEKPEPKLVQKSEEVAEKTPIPSTPTPPAETAAEAETVVAVEPEPDKATAVVDDDGAKTVEAIEETIVAVSTPPPPPAKPAEAEPKAAESDTSPPPPPPSSPEEVYIWGIKLLEDERSDVILLKFLRARDFKAKEAFAMLKNTIRWRKQFRIDELLDEQIDIGEDLEKVVFMNGHSKEGHPVCYNVYGQFQNKSLYQKTFSDEEKRQKFLRWRIQFLEKSIRKLDLSPGGVSTIVQINDLKNSPGPAKWELRQATKQALQLLQDNYPEFVAKQVFINVPWWYLAVNRMISPFLTQRTKSKFVFAGPSKSAETLLKYIAAEQVPVQYGGLSKDGDFVTTDAVTEITVRPSAKHTVEFPVTEKCRLTWEIRVVGWDVSYGAEFVPSAEEGYTVIIQKARKVASTEEPVVRNSFKIGEPGKVVLTIDNPTSRKKKLLYRLKTKTFVD